MMRIIITTPLYPPDLAEPAPYVKELAAKLSENHKISVVLFGRLPETVPGVDYIAIDKRQSVPVRLWQYFIALWKISKEADVVYALNGPSVELTATLVTFLRRLPMILHLGDRDSNEWVRTKPHLRLIKWLAMKRATKHITTLPPPRPEILPFGEKPISASAEHEQNWNKHITNLETIFDVVTKRHD